MYLNSVLEEFLIFNDVKQNGYIYKITVQFIHYYNMMNNELTNLIQYTLTL